MIWWRRLQKSVWVARLTWLLLGFVLSLLLRLPFFAVDQDDELPLVNPFASCPEKLSGAERERRVLREEVAYLKQSVIIEQEACFNVREALKGHEDELAELNEQLAFYRGIVSPEEDAAGMRIHKLELFDEGRGKWQYRLTLMQPVRQATDAKGLIRITVEGLNGDIFRAYTMKELDPSEHFSGLYQFRNFLEMHGQFKLPTGFQPLRIVLKAIPERRGSKPVKRTWVWKDIVAAQAVAS